MAKRLSGLTNEQYMSLTPQAKKLHDEISLQIDATCASGDVDAIRTSANELNERAWALANLETHTIDSASDQESFLLLIAASKYLHSLAPTSSGEQDSDLPIESHCAVIACPDCGEPSLVTDDQGTIQCKQCGKSFTYDVTLTPCPCCGQPLDPSISTMLQCGCHVAHGMCLIHERKID